MNKADYKKFKELTSKIKSGEKLTDAEKKLYAALSAKKVPSRNNENRNSKGAGNDPSWYTKYPELMRGASNIPFNTIAGQPISIPRQFGASGSDMHPAVGNVFHYMRTPGRCTNSNSSFNVQMRAIWLEMHRKYRGMGGYEWADLGIALFAIVNAFADIARAERIYGLTNLYRARNRSYPETILTSLRFDVSQITGDRLADFRYQLNRLITKASILCLPKGFSALEVFLHLDSNVFKDSDSERASWYVYDSPYIVKYDAATQSTGGANKYIVRSYTGSSYTGIGNTQTFDDIIGDLDSQLDLLLSDTDIARICSDILACFGDNTVTLGTLSEDYTIEPVRDDSRLLQLHNTTIAGNLGNHNVQGSIVTGSGVICWMYQQGGDVHFELSSVGASTNGAYYTQASLTRWVTTDSINKSVDGCLCDIWKDDVTPDDVIELTRQTVGCVDRTFTSGGNTYNYVELVSFGLVIITAWEMWSNLRNTTLKYGSRINIFTTDTVTAAPGVGTFSAIASLDWHPPIYGAWAGAYLPILDYDDYRVISNVDLERIHDAATLSAYKIEHVDIVRE